MTRLKRLHNAAVSPTTLLFAAFVCLASPAFGNEAPAARFERIGPYGGDVRSLLIDSQDSSRIYLGTSDGQVIRSEDGGRSWRQLSPGIGLRQHVIDTLVQHPKDAQHIFAGAWDLRSSGGGLFESRDGGMNWSRVSLPTARSAVRDFAICRTQPDSMIVGALEGVYLTSDGGRSWRQVGARTPGFRDVESVAIDPKNPRLLYAGTWRLAYRSRDFGQTWVRVQEGMLFDSDVFSLSLDSRNTNVVFASACTGVYRSINSAGAWKRLKVRPDRFEIRARVVFVDPADSERVYAGTTEGLYLSRDQGDTWTRITSRDLTINAIQVDVRAGRKILIGTDDHGVLTSVDDGRTWQDSNLGFAHRQVTGMTPVPGDAGRYLVKIVGDGADGGYRQYDERKDEWTSLAVGLPAKEAAVTSFLNLPEGRGSLAGTRVGLWHRPTGASEWVRLKGDSERRLIYGLALAPKGDWILAGTDRGVLRAASKDLRFINPATDGFAQGVTRLAIAPGEPEMLYAGSERGLFRSKDAGMTWQPALSGLPERISIESLAVSPIDSAHLFAGTVIGLFESRDGGESWHRASDSRLTVHVPSVIFLDSDNTDRVLAADGTYGGVFLSKDGGESWTKIEDASFSSPARALVRDSADGSTIYVGTHTEGVYRVNLLDPH